MIGHARVHALVVGLGRIQEAHAVLAQRLDGVVDVAARERDVLDALAVIDVEVFLDLRLRVRGLVDGNADLAARARHRARREAGLLALDVEVADLAEVEELLVEPRPIGHAAAVDVVGEVIDELQAVPHRMAVHAVDELEVDVVDRPALAMAVDQVQRRAADTLDRRQAQLHRAGRDLDRLGAQLQCAGIGQRRVLDPKRHAAGRWAMLGSEVRGRAARLVVDDEVDLALAIQHHVLGPVGGHLGEAHGFEHRSRAREGGFVAPDHDGQ